MSGPTGTSGADAARGLTPAVHEYQTLERRLLLRGGELDGRRWAGVIGIGHRVAVGPGPWSTACVYVVTEQEVRDPEGRLENIAVPAPFGTTE